MAIALSITEKLLTQTNGIPMRNFSQGKVRVCRKLQIPTHAPLNILPETGSKQSECVKCKEIVFGSLWSYFAYQK